MLQKLKIEQNIAYTANGALSNKTTMSDCLDLFAIVGAFRNANDAEIITRFMRAYAENPDIAMRILFYARDIRAGLGERRVFRIILNWLAHNHTVFVNNNISRIAEYGRFDDILCLINTPCMENVIKLISYQISKDITAMSNGEEVSLLAKWLPSINTSSKNTIVMAKKIARKLSMSDAEYRKTISALRAYIHILENNLREKRYDFDYSKQPSKALYKYRKAFVRNDGERYNEFLSKVEKGEIKMNTETLTPYDVISPLIQGWSIISEHGTRRTVDVTWNNLEDFTSGENALIVVDGSGSMYSGGNVKPAAVALSLGIYFAERNTGEFSNHFITFSNNPKLVEIKGKTIVDKLKYCASYNEVADTNIQKVFELILRTAVNNNISQENMPSSIYVITDMEFNECTRDSSLTNFEYAQKIFKQQGYKLPQIVFWNVNSFNIQQPVKMNEQGVILVSGCSPRIFEMIANKKLSPYSFMMETLNSERYREIVA